MENTPSRARRSVVAASVAAAVVGFAPAGFAQDAASDWAGIVASAGSEGRVVVYTTTVPAVNQRLKADFESLHPGITVELSRLPTSPEITTRLDQERTAGSDGADLAIMTDVKWPTDRLAEGVSLLAPKGPSAAQWPESYVFEGTFPTLVLEPIVIAYNTDLVKTPVAGYADLLRPEFRGKVAISEPVAGTVVGWYDYLETTQGDTYLSDLAAQNPRILVGAVPNAQAVASGEVAVTGFTNTTVSGGLIEQGAPISVVVPNPGFGFPYVGVLPGWAARPNAAQVFMDYLMSERGQTVWAGKGEVASPIAAPGAVDAAAINVYDASKYPQSVMNDFRAKWQAIFRAN